MGGGADFVLCVYFSFCSNRLGNGEELCNRVCFSFLLFVFHAKLGAKNNYRNGSSDISDKSPVNHDSNEI